MSDMIWLAAQYHLPSTYMCRMPMSSPAAARALPTPGPATVRLALIRNAIELFGSHTTQNMLFSAIRAMPIRIQPPERIAISQQQVKLYKGSSVNKRTQLHEGIGYREVATAEGSLIIHLQLEREVAPAISEVLYAIGTWGSADSLTFCERVIEAEPSEAVVVTLQAVGSQTSVYRRFIGLATEFRDQQVTWEEIGAAHITGMRDAIASQLFIWPLEIYEQGCTGVSLRRCPQFHP